MSTKVKICMISLMHFLIYRLQSSLLTGQTWSENNAGYLSFFKSEEKTFTDALAVESRTLWKWGRRWCLPSCLAQSDSFDAECLKCVPRCAPSTTRTAETANCIQKLFQKLFLLLKEIRACSSQFIYLLLTRVVKCAKCVSLPKWFPIFITFVNKCVFL